MSYQLSFATTGLMIRTGDGAYDLHLASVSTFGGSTITVSGRVVEDGVTLTEVGGSVQHNFQIADCSSPVYATPQDLMDDIETAIAAMYAGGGGGGGTVDTVAWSNQYGMSANTSGTTAVLIQPVGTESVIKTIAQIGHGLTLGQAVRLNGGAYVAAQGNSAANAAFVGFVLEVVSANQFRLLIGGHSAGAPAAMFSGLTAGTAAYLDPTTAGALTNTPNAFGPILMPTSATAGYVIPMTHELTYYNGTAEVLQEAIITGVTDGSGRFAIDMSGAPYSWTNIRYAAITVIDAGGVTYETSYDALTANTGRFQIGDSTGAPVGVDIPVMAILKGA